MTDALYSRDVIQGHLNGGLFIEAFNDNNKAYSTAFGLKRFLKVDRKQSTKKVLNDLLEVLIKSGTEWSKSITINSFDSFIAPFIKQEKLDRVEVRRLLSGFLTQVDNLDVYELALSLDLFTDNKDDIQPEMDIIHYELPQILEKSFLNESQKVVPIINIQENTHWGSPTLSRYVELSYKYGVPHYSNYLTGTISISNLHDLPDSKPEQGAIYLTYGGVIGNADNRGLVGCVALNLPRASYLSKDEDEFMERIYELAETAKKALEQKREHLTNRLKKGLMPITSDFHGSFEWHSSAISIVGVNEALINLIGAGTAHVAGKAVTYKILERMMRIIEEFQTETGHLYTLAAYPSERAGSYMALKDKETYPHMASGSATPYYYTCSSELPPNNSDDLWNALEHQKKFHSIYNGSNVFQIHLKKGLDYREEEKLLLLRCIQQFGYNSIKVSPVYSICRRHGYIQGTSKSCPTCGEQPHTYVWVDGEAVDLNKLSLDLKEASRERVHYDVKSS